MKRKDLIVVGATALISALIAFVVSSAIFGTPDRNPVKVPVVNPISSTFPSPATDDKYKIFYNQNALNPTQLIRIGKDNNNKLFQDQSGQ